MSLVAGNVTGGGGKATTTKTYWHQVLRGTKQNVYSIWMLTGEVLAASSFGIQNQAVSRVYI
jgi:hypothetical protein